MYYGNRSGWHRENKIAGRRYGEKKLYDLIIVGAGAAGLAAAYRASQKGKLNILVLEKERLPGRKLSAAGNGRCNLTNGYFSAERYHSFSHEIVKEWAAGKSNRDILDFFDELGIPLYETNGYYYPMSNQGRQVTELLEQRCRDVGVQFLYERKVEQIRPLESGGYEIKTAGNDSFSQAANVIVSTGGPACPALGGSDFGNRLAEELKLKVHAYFPALSPIYVKDTYLKLAKGVRLDAVVSLKSVTGETIKERGQVQFNEDCLSGIVVMNLSCYYNRWRQAESLYLDTLPERSWEEVKAYYLKQQRRFPEETVFQLLCGIYPKAFAGYLLKRLDWKKETTLKSLGDKQLNRLTSEVKKLTFSPFYREDYEKAQVTGGGVALEEISIDTFECRKYKGLFFTGEMLDIYGCCGGYNLSFALLSGIRAADTVIGRSEG